MARKAQRGWCWCTLKSLAAAGLLAYVLWLGFGGPLVPAEARPAEGTAVLPPAPRGRAAEPEEDALKGLYAPAEGGSAASSPETPPHSAGAAEGAPPRAAEQPKKGRDPAPKPALRAHNGGGRTPLVVALASGLQQFEGTLVVINSAVRNAADPSRLHFRIVTASEEAEPLAKKLRASLPAGTDLEAVSFDRWAPRVQQLLGGSSSERKELFNALNFAAFYLHEVFPDKERVLYLDTDVVVLGDLAQELSERDLEGHPAAGAEDCSQLLGKYIHMDRLKKKGVQNELSLEIKARKKTCVVNRGVVLIDTARWKADNITGVIEALVMAHLSKQKGPLWRSGVSQPPFLLALAGRYHDLGAEYNVRGLGRGDIAPDEIQHYEKLKQWSPYFNRFIMKCEVNCCEGCKGWAMSPYVSPQAEHAKILHFNGRNKPSKRGRCSADPVKPPGEKLSREERGAREQKPLCSCGRDCMQECAGIWWKYLPEVAAE